MGRQLVLRVLHLASSASSTGFPNSRGRSYTAGARAVVNVACLKADPRVNAVPVHPKAPSCSSVLRCPRALQLRLVVQVLMNRKQCEKRRSMTAGAPTARTLEAPSDGGMAMANETAGMGSTADALSGKPVTTLRNRCCMWRPKFFKQGLQRQRHRRPLRSRYFG